MVKEKIAASVQRLDAWLIGIFERPRPRKMAEAALWSVTHIEQIFFLPFRILIVPARLFLENRHAKHIRKHR
jgi:hypothetical protein